VQTPSLHAFITEPRRTGESQRKVFAEMPLGWPAKDKLRPGATHSDVLIVHGSERTTPARRLQGL